MISMCVCTYVHAHVWTLRAQRRENALILDYQLFYTRSIVRIFLCILSVLYCIFYIRLKIYCLHEKRLLWSSTSLPTLFGTIENWLAYRPILFCITAYIDLSLWFFFFKFFLCYWENLFVLVKYINLKVLNKCLWNKWIN